MSHTCLGKLVEELGTAAVAQFIHAFEDLWPIRRAKIHAAVAGRDFDAAMEAVLSLHSAASMAGARPLAEHANLIRGALSAPGAPAWADAQHLLTALDVLGAKTMAALPGGITGDPQSTIYAY